MTGFLFVGLGGAIGAMLRYAVSLIPYKGTFPVLTLVTNVCGADCFWPECCVQGDSNGCQTVKPIVHLTSRCKNLIFVYQISLRF